MSGLINHALWKSRIGQTFNYLTVTGRNSFKCVCGKEYAACYANVRAGRAKSCGCKEQELKTMGHIKHGLTNTRRYCLLVSARYRARITGREFDLEISDIAIPEKCPVFGMTLRTGAYGSCGRAQDDSPSVDRVDSTRGYTKDNIRVISWRANRLKQAMTAIEARQLAEYMENHGNPIQK